MLTGDTKQQALQALSEIQSAIANLRFQVEHDAIDELQQIQTTRSVCDALGEYAMGLVQNQPNAQSPCEHCRSTEHETIWCPLQ